MASQDNKWLITGAGGKLGSVLFQCLQNGPVSAIGTVSPIGPCPKEGSTYRTDLTDKFQLQYIVSVSNPDVIIHTAAVTDMKEAFRSPLRAYNVNVDATVDLCRLAEKENARFVFISTDMVFDGENAPYTELDRPNPKTVYGQSKFTAEQAVLAYQNSLVIRLPLMYGLYPVRRQSFFLQQIHALQEYKPLKLYRDEYRTPMSLVDAAKAIMVAAASNLTGTVHLCGSQRISRLQMGRAIARALSISNPRFESMSLDNVPSPEPRPRDLSLNCDLFINTFGKPPARTIQQNLYEITKQIDNPTIKDSLINGGSG